MDEEEEREIIVSLRPGGDGRRVGDWFEGRGFEVVPMSAGVLVSGEAGLIAKLFAVALDDVLGHGHQSLPLPTPPDLAADVTSIVLKGLPSLHGD